MIMRRESSTLLIVLSIAAFVAMLLLFPFVYVAVVMAFVALAGVALVFAFIRDTEVRKAVAVIALVFLAALGTRALW